MPVEYILVPFTVPVPIHFTPQFIYSLRQCFFLGSAVNIILMYGKQSLHEKSRLYKVAAIVFLTEGFHFSSLAIPPMGIGAFEAVGTFEKRNYFFHAYQSVGTGNVPPVDAGKNGHDTKTTATRGDDIRSADRIVTVHMNTFRGETAIGLRTIPEI